MCLVKVTKTYTEPQKGVRRGYKVVFKQNQTVRFRFSITKEWQEDHSPVTIRDFDHENSYPGGFHIFTKREDAEYLSSGNIWFQPTKVVTVEFNDVVAEGLGDGYTNNNAHQCIARKIRLIEDEPTNETPKETQ